MDKNAVLGIARHILTTLGGILTTRGVLGESDVEVVVGAVVALAGVVWSVFEKRSRA
jgi:hypothetical protein